MYVGHTMSETEKWFRLSIVEGLLLEMLCNTWSAKCGQSVGAGRSGR